MKPAWLSRMFVLSLTAPLTACLALLDLQPLGFEPADSGADERRADDAPNDTSVPSDGGIDAANHCSDGKRHDFCDDFEGITGALEDRWQKRKEVNGTGLVATEITDAAPSPVTVFRSTSERGAEGGTTAHVARLSRQESPWPRTPAGAQPGVRIFFEVSFEQLDVAPYNATIMNARIGSGPGVEDYLSVFAYREGTEAVLTLFEVYTTDAGVQYSSKEIPTRVPLATWTAIELLIQERPNGSPGGAVLTVGTTSAPFTLSSISRSPDFRTDVGISVGSGGTQSAVLYDDVRMDYLP